MGLRTATERPDRPPLTADASVVTAVANMPEAAARGARAGPQERSEKFRERHSPAFVQRCSGTRFHCRRRRAPRREQKIVRDHIKHSEGAWAQ